MARTGRPVHRRGGAAVGAGGRVTVYCGFDPTAPSLHFGNLVQLILLRHLHVRAIR